jgi:hypothetical protein
LHHFQDSMLFHLNSPGNCIYISILQIYIGKFGAKLEQTKKMCPKPLFKAMTQNSSEFSFFAINVRKNIFCCTLVLKKYLIA